MHTAQKFVDRRSSMPGPGAVGVCSRSDDLSADPVAPNALIGTYAAF